jgi:hypothetical protein
LAIVSRRLGARESASVKLLTLLLRGNTLEWWGFHPVGIARMGDLHTRFVRRARRRLDGQHRPREALTELT